LLCKIFGRVKGTSSSFIVSIAYLEDISNSGYPCLEWKDKDKLTEDQKQYIKDFSERFIELFDVMEYTKLGIK